MLIYIWKWQIHPNLISCSLINSVGLNTEILKEKRKLCIIERSLGNNLKIKGVMETFQMKIGKLRNCMRKINIFDLTQI